MKDVKRNVSDPFGTQTAKRFGWFTGGGLTRFANSSSSVLRGLYVFSHPLIVTCIVLYTLLLNVPARFLNSNELIASLVQVVQAHVSWPGAFAKISDFPVQTRAFFSVWLISCPIMLVFIVPRIVRAERSHWHTRWSAMSLKKLFILTMGAPVFLAGFIVGILIPGDPSFCAGCTTHSKAGLLFLYGLCVPTGLSLFIAGIPCLFLFTFKSFSRTHLRRNRG